MADTYIGDIAEFHQKFELPAMTLDGFRASGMAEFRLRFLLEELGELQQAAGKRDLEKYLDALVDLDYVLLGTAYLIAGVTAQLDAIKSDRATNWDSYWKVVLPRRTPTLPRVTRTLYFVAEVTRSLDALARQLDNSPQWTDHLAPSVRYVHAQIVDHAHHAALPYSEAWDRVHAANMAKVRAQRAGDSTRGSTFDVVKPPGWAPASLTDLVTPR